MARELTGLYHGMGKREVTELLEKIKKI